MPRLSSRSANIDQTLRDLYTRFCTGSDASKYSAFLAGMAVAFWKVQKKKKKRTRDMRTITTSYAIRSNLIKSSKTCSESFWLGSCERLCVCVSYPEYVQRSVVVLVPQLHLAILTPHTRQIIHHLVVHLGGLLKDGPCLTGLKPIRIPTQKRPLTCSTAKRKMLASRAEKRILTSSSCSLSS